MNHINSKTSRPVIIFLNIIKKQFNSENRKDALKILIFYVCRKIKMENYYWLKR